MKQELEVLKAKFRALSMGSRMIVMALLAVVGIGGPIECYHLHSVANAMGGLVEDTNKIHTQQHGGVKFGANVDHSTTTIHGGHSLVVEGDTLGGFMSGADKTKLDGVATGADVTTESSVRTATASFSADPSFNSHKITSLADGTAASDSAAFHQIADAVLAGKASAVSAVSSGNLTLSGTQTVDGVALVAGNRCLAYGQTTSTQDGVYVVASGAWTRATDLPSGTGAADRCFVAKSGTSNKGVWCATNASGSDVVGTADLVFANVATGGGGGAVSSVNTQTGAVVLGAKDVAALGGIVVDAVTTAALPAYTAAGAGVGKTITLNASAACPTLGGLTPTTTTTGVVGSYNTLLLQNPASFVDFGVYDVTTSTGSSCVLTRDTRADTMIEIVQTTVRVAQGNRRGALYQYGGDPTITLDTGLGSYERIDAAVGTNEVFDQTCEFGSDMVPSGNVANGTVGVGNCPFVASVSGTGAAITQSAGTATESGVFIMGGGSTSGGFSAWTGNTSTLPVLIDVNQGALFEVRWTGPSVLSNGTNRFGMFAGWASATNLPNAVGIEYIDSTASTWFGQFCTGSSCTPAATGLPTVVINTYSRGRVFKYPGESAFHVVVDGTEATGSPFSTNVPLNVAMTPVIEIFDTIGSATNATLKLDYVRQRQWWPQGRGQ